MPFQLAKMQLDVRLTGFVVEVLHNGQRVASHVRSPQACKHTTLTAHMPKSHQKHLEWTPQRLLNWGESIGPATCSIIRNIMEAKPHPEMGYRSCLGVFSLSKRYGEDRLEAACARALAIGKRSCSGVKSGEGRVRVVIFYGSVSRQLQSYQMLVSLFALFVQNSG